MFAIQQNALSHTRIHSTAKGSHTNGMLNVELVFVLHSSLFVNFIVIGSAMFFSFGHCHANTLQTNNESNRKQQCQKKYMI